MNPKTIQIRKISQPITGSIDIPADKSISHRALIFNSIAKGSAKIRNLLLSEDVLCTKNILKQLGITIIDHEDCIEVIGGDFKQPEGDLYCGNSGTTMRLMLGLLAPHDISVRLTGDESLSKRPMRRVTTYLKGWNVCCQGADGDAANYAPIQLKGNSNISFFVQKIPIASAQVKSALALVALQSNGGLISGGGSSRDHTERMIQAMGGRCISNQCGDISVEPSQLQALDITIPSDISSASFFIALALLVPASKIFLPNINLNPTRRGFLDTLLEMEADITIENQRMEGAEEVGDVTVRYSLLKGSQIPEKRIATMIDEIPILSVLASQAYGKTSVTGAEDLKYKESDRLMAIGRLISAFGMDIRLLDDGFEIEGPQKASRGTINSQGDHRIAMSGIILASIAEGESKIENLACIATSFPSFLQKYKELRGDIE